MQKLPIEKAYHWIEPGPVILLTTRYRDEMNVMTMSCHMQLGLDPPRIGCGLGPWDHSFEALLKTRECVLAVPGTDLMKKTVAIGNCSGADVDKFAAYHLTAMPGTKVAAPRIKEALANIECRIVDISLARRYNLFVAEVVAAWTNPARKEQRIFHAYGDGTFAPAGRRRDLKRDMVKWQDMP